MIQRSTLLCLLLAMLSGYALFHMTDRAQRLEEELARLGREIADDREAIHVLRAEWAYLNQPAMLRERVEHHQEQLGLVPVRPEQIVRYDNLPARPVFADGAPGAAVSLVTPTGGGVR